MQRRTFLQLMGAGLASLPFIQRRARGGKTPAQPVDYFIFIHAAGGWDVTLWSDPRNQKQGLIDPADASNTDVTGMKLWKPAANRSFEPLVTASGRQFGPGLGALFDLADRLTVINGLAMNTVSHPDGACFSVTGRHLAGTRAPVSSVDSVLASATGSEQLLPLVSMQFPSAYVDGLDPRAVPLKVAGVGGLGRSLARSPSTLTPDDRSAIAQVLTDEANDLARRSPRPEIYQRLSSQYQALPRMLGGDVSAAFDPAALRGAYPELDYRAGDDNDGSLAAAFALEACARNAVRCVSFALGQLDSHTGVTYRGHARQLVQLFGTVAAMIRRLDATPHPLLAGRKLSEHTHLFVLSEFCRTPGINLAGGRDHYPNNSALIISPRFRPITYGKTDHEQLLPAPAGTFSDGERAIAPPDLLATILSAFGVDPAPHVRDGEVVKELLVS